MQDGAAAPEPCVLAPLESLVGDQLGALPRGRIQRSPFSTLKMNPFRPRLWICEGAVGAVVSRAGRPAYLEAVAVDARPDDHCILQLRFWQRPMQPTGPDIPRSPRSPPPFRLAKRMSPTRRRPGSSCSCWRLSDFSERGRIRGAQSTGGLGDRVKDLIVPAQLVLCVRRAVDLEHARCREMRYGIGRGRLIRPRANRTAGNAQCNLGIGVCRTRTLMPHPAGWSGSRA